MEKNYVQTPYVISRTRAGKEGLRSGYYKNNNIFNTGNKIDIAS